MAMCPCRLRISIISSHKWICRPKIFFHRQTFLFVCIFIGCTATRKVLIMKYLIKVSKRIEGFINVFKFLYVSISSLYLEEAFEALHFQHRRQIRFVIGSLVAALLGVILNVYQARLKEDKIAEKQHGTLPKEQQETLFKFGLIHHLGLAFCAILSTLVFETELSTPTWIISIINLSGMFLYLFIDE